MDPQTTQAMFAAMMAAQAASKSSQRIAAKGAKGGKGGRGDTGRGRGRGGVTKPAHNLQQQWHGDEYLQQQQGKGGGKGARGKGGGGAKNFWEARPDLARLRTLHLDDAAKEQLGALFGMMDANGDGFLKVDDFEIIAHRSSTLAQAAKSKALMYFTKLQEELDADNHGRITLDEFTRGIINLALKKPAGPMLHSIAGSSDLLAVKAAWTRMTNFEVQELCKVLYNWWVGFPHSE